MLLGSDNAFRVRRAAQACIRAGDSSVGTRFQRKLPSHIYRYRWLQRFLYPPLASKAHVVDTLHQIWRMNQKKATGRKSWLKQLARSDVKQMLRDTLAEDVTRLSNLLQRDLSPLADRAIVLSRAFVTICISP
jgi:ABC-type antimicrobial peptide transport system ATPase subunit